MKGLLIIVFLAALVARGSIAAVHDQVVVAAHPLAAAAGRDVLRQGGNAMDAAVAVQMVLAVVEPQESGVGGGGFLMYFDAATGSVTFHDGREVAPQAATPDRFLLPGGLALPFPLAMVSGRAVGVPGLVPMLHAAHAAHGSRPWSELFEAAIDHAETGVPFPARLRRQLDADPSLWLFAATRELVRAGRESLPVLRNPELAGVLRRIAAEGPDALQAGELAVRVVDAANAGFWFPGDLTVTDLASYVPRVREPVCARYRQWTVCGAAPPSSAGIALLQALGTLAHFDLAALDSGGADAVHLIAEASRLAFADRQQYVGDPDFVTVPVAGLIDPDYLAARARLIDPDRAMLRAGPGIPGLLAQVSDPPPLEVDAERGTTHFSIVDGAGNAVALTSSIEAPFGARREAGGYLLNNQLTDFDFRPEREGVPAPNAVAAGKRPRSSMAPTFVFDAGGELVLVIGSRGGSRIIGYVLKTLLGVLDWGLSLEDAVALPNVVHRGERLELEVDTPLAELAEALEARGHRVSVRRLESGLHGIERVDSGWRGAPDPRMDGAAAGLATTPAGSDQRKYMTSKD